MISAVGFVKAPLIVTVDQLPVIVISPVKLFLLATLEEPLKPIPDYRRFTSTNTGFVKIL